MIICINYNTYKSALPDIYAQRPKAHNARGHTAPKGECIYIRQSTSACVIITMLHFQHYKICPNLKLTGQVAYIVTDTDCDFGRYFNVFITFPNVSMTYPIAVILIMGLYSH